VAERRQEGEHVNSYLLRVELILSIGTSPTSSTVVVSNVLRSILNMILSYKQIAGPVSLLGCT
jgi:hypothetical protein